MALGLAEAPDLAQGSPQKKSSTMAPPSPTTKANRRLSNLITTQTNRIEAASDAVRESIIDSADQALGRINNTLDNSFKFLFGRMKEMDPNSSADQPALPKTLEEARQLVTSPSKLPSEPKKILVPGIQIQYSQMVNLNFAGLTWPHVSVATLVPTGPQPFTMT